MKEHKLLLTGLILLLLIILVAIFTWLWTSNRKNTDPLPIITNGNDSSTAAADRDENTVNKSILHIQAEEKLQEPLDDIIASFQSRYPYVQILTSYVSSAALLTLSDNNFTDSKLPENEYSAFIVNTDLIITDGKLSKERLSPLQEQLKIAQDKHNQRDVNATQDGAANDNPNTDENFEKVSEDATAVVNTKNDNTVIRNLVAFSYALKDTKTVDGVILTQNPIAINFRNFLLSSTGQDILNKYNYDNIDGYQNDIDNLFKPSSRASQASGQHSVDVADVLSNGK